MRARGVGPGRRNGAARDRTGCAAAGPRCAATHDRVHVAGAISPSLGPVRSSSPDGGAGRGAAQHQRAVEPVEAARADQRDAGCAAGAARAGSPARSRRRGWSGPAEAGSRSCAEGEQRGRHVQRRAALVGPAGQRLLGGHRRASGRRRPPAAPPPRPGRSAGTPSASGQTTSTSCGAHAGPVQGQPQRPRVLGRVAGAVRGRCAAASWVARPAGHLAVDPGAPGQRVPQLLHHEDRAALGRARTRWPRRRTAGTPAPGRRRR